LHGCVPVNLREGLAGVWIYNTMLGSCQQKFIRRTGG
jgi:hypothetical protein